ncbi:MAG: chain length determinant protein EpsF [Betaproteobacteria bacterium HGW-Betaproteobacteria-21]|nr:MAG: chain length determinant protein EpsF [Betaproteobacteria bacterium HGW-Betaproteobacteria-21]
MSFDQFFQILRARLWTIVAIFVGVVVLVMGVSLALPKKYTAEASVVVDGKAADPLLSTASSGQTATGYVSTQVDIIASSRVAQRVVTMTGLDQLPAFQERWRETTDGVGSLQVWLGNSLRRGLDVRPSRESSVISISYTATDAEFAAAIANAFAQAYIDTALELKVEPAKQYANWFNERTRGLRDEVEIARKKLSDYQQANSIVASDARFDVESARMAELSTQLVAVQGQRADSRSRQSQTGSAESLPEVVQNPLVSSLKADVARIESQRQQMIGKLGANHPDLMRIDADLASMRQRIGLETDRIVRSLGTSTRVSVAREADIAAAVEAQKVRLLELQAHRDQIAVLQRDVENAQRAYDLVTQRLMQTNLESQTQQTNIAVLTAASVPASPSSPRLLLNALLACVFGAALGCGVALLLELLNARVRSADDLARELGLPVLGVIPGNDAVKRGWRRRSAHASA